MGHGATPASEEPIRLLLVEDHPTSREPLAMLLDREPDLTVVGQAGSLAEVRRSLAGGLAVDVTLLDLDLPDGDGADLIRDLRRVNPRAITLVLTASADRATLARAVAAGAAHVLHKSAATREIVAAIRRLWAGEVLLDPREAAELIRLAGERRRRDMGELAALASLTPRERDALRLLAEGLDNQAIAARLGVGLETARTHVGNVLHKLEVESRVQAVLVAHRHGVVSFD
jgi:DNA-binding NarL/FixJ family response regulator